MSRGRQSMSWNFRTRNIPATFIERQAQLGSIVLRVLPKVMQTILKECMSASALHVKYRLKDIRTTLTEHEISLMEKLPNMDDFTIELCYKILRYENLMLEPSCKWGNAPNITDIEIADDIQRLLIATNEIVVKKSEDVSENYYEEFQKKLHQLLNRVDTFLQKDTCLTLYKTICKSKIISTDILQELAQLQQIDIIQVVDEYSMNIERLSRISLVIIDSFPEILRDIIRSIISPGKLYQMCVPHLSNFFTDQQTCLRDLQSSNSYDSFDVSLIYKLLRQFSLVSQPTKGWGNIPDKADTQLSDDIERIRNYRNRLAHSGSTHTTKEEFDNYFDQFGDIGHRMDLYFFKKTNYAHKIIGYKTCRIDRQMQITYNNTLKELENLKLRFEQHPVRFFWGTSFERCLINLRSMLQIEKSEDKRKVRVQIIFETEKDMDRTIEILNSLKDDINESLSGIEFIVATQGSIVLHTDILSKMLETDDILQSTLAVFLRKVLERILTSKTENIDMILFMEEEYTQWNVSKAIGEPVNLDFDIEARFFETDDKMNEQLTKISNAISKHFNGSGTNNGINATLLPIYLENTTREEANAQTHSPDNIIPITTAMFAQAQTPVTLHLPVSVIYRERLIVKQDFVDVLDISSCIKISNTLVFTDYDNDQLIICNADGTDIHYISLSHKPYYITEINSNTVAVTSTADRFILMINLSTADISSISTSSYCLGTSYDDNNLYVVIVPNIIHVMDLTGKVIRTIPLPSDNIHNITVDRHRLVCIDYSSIYCCSLDGTLIWKSKNDKFKDLRGVTTDNEGNVYVTEYGTKTVVLVFDDGRHYTEILSKSDGLDDPWGIYFDKKENILMVCNSYIGQALLFDIKKKLS